MGGRVERTRVLYGDAVACGSTGGHQPDLHGEQNEVTEILDVRQGLFEQCDVPFSRLYIIVVFHDHPHIMRYRQGEEKPERAEPLLQCFHADFEGLSDRCFDWRAYLGDSILLILVPAVRCEGQQRVSLSPPFHPTDVDELCGFLA